MHGMGGNHQDPAKVYDEAWKVYLSYGATFAVGLGILILNWSGSGVSFRLFMGFFMTAVSVQIIRYSLR